VRAMRRRELCSIVVIAILALSTLTASAHDLLGPSWRGEEGTTFQIWDFTTPDLEAIPEVDQNPYGDPVAQINLGEYSEGWFDQLEGLGDTVDYWDLGSSGTIEIVLPNSPDPNPYKEIWVQVTYYEDITQAPVLNIPGATYLGGVDHYLVENVGTGNWFLDLLKFRIEPNPTEETIILTSDGLYGSLIDQIVIDTICVPEPMTMSLLALGSIFVIRRKRHQS